AKRSSETRATVSGRTSAHRRWRPLTCPTAWRTAAITGSGWRTFGPVSEAWTAPAGRATRLAASRTGDDPPGRATTAATPRASMARASVGGGVSSQAGRGDMDSVYEGDLVDLAQRRLAAQH